MVLNSGLQVKKPLARDRPSPRSLAPPSIPSITTFHLAYPPPHSSSPFRWVKPQLQVQLLQQARIKKRLQPVFEIFLVPPAGIRYRHKDVHCRSGDLVLVPGDFHSDCTLPDGSQTVCSEDDEHEEEVSGRNQVIAVVRDPRKNHSGENGRGKATEEERALVKFFFSCGAIWEAIAAHIGHYYQLVAVNRETINNRVYKLMSWTRDPPPYGSENNEDSGTQPDGGFRLTMVDGNSKYQPVVATVTRRSIQIMYHTLKQDILQGPFPAGSSLFLSSTGRERAQSPRSSDNPFGSFDTSASDISYLLCLVLTSAVWVASNEGWLA
ncbi:hypothetical protein BJY01DRAFT_236869 [Aspergillus pseudoustus]|uniref:Uncharacterized protein n=1 Tax=Aspergillus pseudoustus TaxID=1810923 RepID=A0ABR4JJH8_9EURO